MQYLNTVLIFLHDLNLIMIVCSNMGYNAWDSLPFVNAANYWRVRQNNWGHYNPIFNWNHNRYPYYNNYQHKQVHHSYPRMPEVIEVGSGQKVKPEFAVHKPKFGVSKEPEFNEKNDVLPPTTELNQDLDQTEDENHHEITTELNIALEKPEDNITTEFKIDLSSTGKDSIYAPLINFESTVGPLFNGLIWSNENHDSASGYDLEDTFNPVKFIFSPPRKDQIELKIFNLEIKNETLNSTENYDSSHGLKTESTNEQTYDDEFSLISEIQTTAAEITTSKMIQSVIYKS